MTEIDWLVIYHLYANYPIMTSMNRIDVLTTTDEIAELKKQLSAQMTTCNIRGSTAEKLRIIWDIGNTRCNIAEKADTTRFKMEGNVFKKNEMNALLAITRVPDCMDRTRLYDKIASRSIVEFDKWNANRYMYVRKEWNLLIDRLIAVSVSSKTTDDTSAQVFRKEHIQFIINLFEGMDMVQLAKRIEYKVQAAEMRELWVDTMSMTDPVIS